MNNDEQNLFLARVAEQAEQFDDMVCYLEQFLVSKGAAINADERNLLSVAFKNLISSKRSACKTIQALEKNPKYASYAEALITYKTSIEAELIKDCERLINIINDHGLQTAEDGEPNPFFVKMVGEQYRYISEHSKGDQQEEAKEKFEATNSIVYGSSGCDPIKLGMAMSYSVFQYEVNKDHKLAIELAQKALLGALDNIEELNDFDEDKCRDAKSIIELLKENLAQWKKKEAAVDGVNED